MNKAAWVFERRSDIETRGLPTRASPLSLPPAAPPPFAHTLVRGLRCKQGPVGLQSRQTRLNGRGARFHASKPAVFTCQCSVASARDDSQKRVWPRGTLWATYPESSGWLLGGRWTAAAVLISDVTSASSPLSQLRVKRIFEPCQFGNLKALVNQRLLCTHDIITERLF